MELYYHKSALGNFGDDLNLWIWDRLLPGWRNWDPDRVLVGVGTLLSSDLLRRVDGRDRRFLVAGTGVGYGTGQLPEVSDHTRWDMRCVRGPLSARSLGLPEDMGIVDPAVMIATFPEFQNVGAGARTLFIPHESCVVRHDWASACAEAGLDYVSPRDDAHAVIAKIASASSVLAESMHAAIIADAFRVPWIPVRIGPRFLTRKWLDWAASLDIELPEIPPLFPVEESVFSRPQALMAARRAKRRKGSDKASASPTAVDHAARPGRIERTRIAVEGAHVAGALRRQMRRAPYLSRDQKLAVQVDRYRTVLEGIRNDYG